MYSQTQLVLVFFQFSLNEFHYNSTYSINAILLSYNSCGESSCMSIFVDMYTRTNPWPIRSKIAKSYLYILKHGNWWLLNTNTCTWNYYIVHGRSNGLHGVYAIILGGIIQINKKVFSCSDYLTASSSMRYFNKSEQQCNAYQDNNERLTKWIFIFLIYQCHQTTIIHCGPIISLTSHVLSSDTLFGQRLNEPTSKSVLCCSAAFNKAMKSNNNLSHHQN